MTMWIIPAGFAALAHLLVNAALSREVFLWEPSPWRQAMLLVLLWCIPVAGAFLVDPEKPIHGVFQGPQLKKRRFLAACIRCADGGPSMDRASRPENAPNVQNSCKFVPTLLEILH